MSYGIKPFKDVVLFDFSPLVVCDVILVQPYMWKRHIVYESRPHSVIVTLGAHHYRIPKVVLTTVLTQWCNKFFSHTMKFIFFAILEGSE